MNDTISPNDINIAQDELFKTIELLCERYMKNMNKADETIECKIIDDSKAKNHIYTVVTSNNVKLDVQSENTEYEVDDRVQVLIPQGNYNAVKRIVGKCYENLANNYAEGGEQFYPLAKNDAFITPSEIINASYLWDQATTYTVTFLKEPVGRGGVTINLSEVHLNRIYDKTDENNFYSQDYHGTFRGYIYQGGTKVTDVSALKADGTIYQLKGVFTGHTDIYLSGSACPWAAPTDYNTAVNALEATFQLSCKCTQPIYFGAHIFNDGGSLMATVKSDALLGNSAFYDRTSLQPTLIFNNTSNVQKIQCFVSTEVVFIKSNSEVDVIETDYLLQFYGPLALTTGVVISDALKIVNKGIPYYTESIPYNLNQLQDPFYNQVSVFLCDRFFSGGMRGYFSGEPFFWDYFCAPETGKPAPLYQSFQLKSWEIVDCVIPEMATFDSGFIDGQSLKTLSFSPTDENNTWIEVDKTIYPCYGVNSYLIKEPEYGVKYKFSCNVMPLSLKTDQKVYIRLCCAYKNEEEKNYGQWVLVDFEDGCGETLVQIQAPSGTNNEFTYGWLEIRITIPWGFVDSLPANQEFTVKTEDGHVYNASLAKETHITGTITGMIKNKSEYDVYTLVTYKNLFSNLNIYRQIHYGVDDKFNNYWYRGETHFGRLLLEDSGYVLPTSRIISLNIPVDFFSGNTIMQEALTYLQNNGVDILPHTSISNSQGSKPNTALQWFNVKTQLYNCTLLHPQYQAILHPITQLVPEGAQISPSGAYGYGSDQQWWYKWYFVSGENEQAWNLWQREPNSDSDLRPQWRINYDDAGHKERTFRVKIYHKGEVIGSADYTLQLQDAKEE